MSTRVRLFVKPFVRSWMVTKTIHEYDHECTNVHPRSFIREAIRAFMDGDENTIHE
ncbi:MAG: hypothetical protein HND47_17100 [Chloroflexi bacterium]|nr:hypothetical protein [Chloroflexota bacterium]